MHNPPLIPQTTKVARPLRISSFSVIVVFVCLSIIGLSIVPLLNIQLNPTVSAPGLSVSYAWHNVSERVVEQEVTAKLEGLFSAVKGLKDISSVSSQGYGRIDLTFKKGVNMDAARFEIACLIRQSYLELPPQVSYPQLSPNTSSQAAGPLLTYTLNASASPYYIQKYAKENLLPALNKIKGISDIQIYGASPYEWEIEFDVNKLKNVGLTANDISEGINHYFSHEFIGKGNYLIPGEQHINETTLLLQYNTPDYLLWENIPIQKVGERIIYLKDLAKVQFQEQIPRSYFRINGLNTVNIVFYPEKGANSILLGNKIKKEIEAIQSKLPPGYSLTVGYDTTTYLSKELNKIALRSALSLGILLVFVLLFSRQWKYLLLIVLNVVVNISISFIFYYFLKIEIHLYSLAGLTISFGFIMDTSIIMIDHYRNTHNRKVFLAILGAALTTMGALCIIFLLKEEQRLNLLDFALVIITSLFVSMAVALFFIPAVMAKIKLGKRKSNVFARSTKRLIKLSYVYNRSIVFSKRWKWIYLLLFILSFGLPVHWLPDKLDGENYWATLYNETIGSDLFKEYIKPNAELILGGSLRLFTEHVFENAFYADPVRTTLYVRGQMPEGCTVQQLNEAIGQMENFISQFTEVESFQALVNSPQNSSIEIHFKPAYEWGNFPYFLKSQLEAKAISMGGADWSVYGVGQGFSNAIHTGFKNSRIELEGYNYEQLYQYAEMLRQKLLENPRIKEVDITGSDDWGNQMKHEYFLAFNAEQLALNQVTPIDFYTFLQDNSYHTALRPVYAGQEQQMVNLKSDTYQQFNVWDLNHKPIHIKEKLYKMSQFATIEKRKTGNEIYKNNQQYLLVVAYDFIGPDQLSTIVKKQHIKEMNDALPLGYKAFVTPWDGWNKEEKGQYYLIILVIVIIYFICSILFESLLQPLAIIAIIPIAFIGVFLTFYLFDFNFDQGGFASFILLCGVVVNAGLYIINDFNNYRKTFPKRSRERLYLKAFNYKIRPIFLTLLSSILALIPFIWEGQQEVFWFAFAVGSIGGLIFSIIAIIIYLPLFLSLKTNR